MEYISVASHYVTYIMLLLYIMLLPLLWIAIVMLFFVAIISPRKSSEYIQAKIGIYWLNDRIVFFVSFILFLFLLISAGQLKPILLDPATTQIDCYERYASISYPKSVSEMCNTARFEKFFERDKEI